MKKGDCPKEIKMTKEQRKAIKRICAEYGFDDFKELKEWFKDFYGDPLDLDMWDKTEDGLYDEISKMIKYGDKNESTL